jgi:predicted 2-oxoglutarate/Fe(II)-dependent dioxygenase YbiX
VGQLNDSFEGGEFVVLDKTIKMKAGDLLIFPSNFIFEHQVKTITKGTRLSFISWVY